MTEEQALRLIEIAMHQREAMAEQVAAIVLTSDITNFVPEIARADFEAWCAAQEAGDAA